MNARRILVSVALAVAGLVLVACGSQHSTSSAGISASSSGVACQDQADGVIITDVASCDGMLLLLTSSDQWSPVSSIPGGSTQICTWRPTGSSSTGALYETSGTPDGTMDCQLLQTNGLQVTWAPGQNPSSPVPGG